MTTTQPHDTGIWIGQPPPATASAAAPPPSTTTAASTRQRWERTAKKHAAALEDTLVALAYAIADNACVADIETEGCVQTDEHGRRWYDTRPMLDPREMSDDFAEMNRQAIDYALARGLVRRHLMHSHLVRITTAGPGRETIEDLDEAVNARCDHLGIRLAEVINERDALRDALLLQLWTLAAMQPEAKGL